MEALDKIRRFAPWCDFTRQLKEFLHAVLDTSQAEKTLHLVQDLTDGFTKESYPALTQKEKESGKV